MCLTMKTLLTVTSLMLTALPVVASDSGQGVFLPMREFDRRMDNAHASCASKDLEFSFGFYDCLDKAMEGSISTAAPSAHAIEPSQNRVFP